MDTAYHDDPKRYDRTRGLPPAVEAAIVNSLAMELPKGGWALDLGAGSGRIAIPLAYRGFRVVAADLSAEMLLHLLAKRAKEAVFPAAVQADAMRLPFGRGTFPAAFSVHTLHLVADLTAALDEIARVVKGVFALGYIEHTAHAPIGWVMNAWRQALAKRGYDLSRPMWRDHPEIVAALTQRFGKPKTVIAARWEREISPAKALSGVSERLFTPYWGLPDEEHAAVVEELRQAAVQKFGDIERPRREPRRFVWHFFNTAA